MHVIYTCGLLWALLQLGNGLLLGAFNIRIFGQKKVGDQTVMDYINKIVHRYDIILIEEIRDPDGSVTKAIMARINNKAVPGEYRYIESEPLGESAQKERYLFLYREDTVSLVQNYTYPDTDRFSRPPFVVMFSIKNKANGNFVLIPLHARPKKAVEEVDALYDVYDHIKKKWATNDILLLGDFNAACDYVKEDDWVEIRLFTKDGFHWLISNDVDTTVGPRQCAYDRIVSTDDMLKRVKKDSAAVYNYRDALGLDQTMALKVSDHFPVEVTLTTL